MELPAQLEYSMNFSQTGSVILAVPFILLLALFVFRLDSLLFRTPAKQAVARPQRPRFANFEPSSMLMTDPDGRVSYPARRQRPQLLRDSVARSKRPL